MTPSPRAGAIAAAILLLLLAVPAASQAFTSNPVWQCRASALYSSVNGQNRVEPLVANGNPSTANNTSPDRAQCATEEAGADNLATPLGIPSSLVSAQSASARTTIEPPLGLAIDQKVTAEAKVERLALPLGGTSVVLGAGAATSQVTASCAGGQPKLDGTSSFLDLTLGGTPIDLNGLVGALQDLLSPLGVVVDAKFNEQVRQGTSLTVRAAHIKLLGGSATTPLADIVIGETKVSGDAATCDPNKQIPGLNQQVCPTGSTFNSMTGVCIITIDRNGSAVPAGTAGSGVLVVGRPFEGPAGGTVIPLVDARKRYRSPCLSGSGPKYVVVGTNGRDRITGTDRRDRILGLGGRDSLEGGRGADCVDGGTGNDRMAGGVGSDRLYGQTGNDTMTGDLDNDKMYGGKGNDKVNGGPGRDRLIGGAGRDVINAGFGADRISAGAGNDVVNIATQGPPASASCGSGRDKIRLNQKERKRLRGCETQYVLRDR